MFAPVQSAGQTPPGQVTSQECCLPLLFPFGARAVSLGQALTARASADALFFNPAGLYRGGADEFILHTSKTFEGQDNVFSVLFQSEVIGAFGLSYVLVDQGEDAATDDFGNETGTLSIRHQEVIASFATPVMTGLRAGVSYKLFNFSYACVGFCGGLAQSGTTHLLDAGVQYRADWARGLELGAAVTQLGFKLQVVNAEQADQTPARLRLGAAYELAQHFRADSLLKAWLSVDMVARLRGKGGPVLNVGAEVGLDEIIFVRAGYASSGDGLAKGGPGIGIGIKFRRFDIGVAKAFARSELETEGGEPFQLTIRVAF